MRRRHLVAGTGIVLVLATPIAAATALIPDPTDTPTPSPSESPSPSPTGTPTPTPTGPTPMPTETPGEPAWPPADTDGEWLPVPDELYPAGEKVQACGSTVTLTAGDVTSVEYMANQAAEGGPVRVSYRGATTVDVRRADGATLHELDASGIGYELYTLREDGTVASITFSWEGPAIVGAFDAVEAAAFAERGLSPLFYYTEGHTTELVTLGATEDADIASAEFLTDTAVDVRDVCDMLDDAAPGTTPPPTPAPSEPPAGPEPTATPEPPATP